MRTFRKNLGFCDQCDDAAVMAARDPEDVEQYVYACGVHADTLEAWPLGVHGDRTYVVPLTVWMTLSDDEGIEFSFDVSEFGPGVSNDWEAAQVYTAKQIAADVAMLNSLCSSPGKVAADG